MDGSRDYDVLVRSTATDRQIRVAAVLFVLDGVGFGLPTWGVARYLTAHGELPTFFGLFPMYGGPYYNRLDSEAFVRRLAVFRLVCAAEVVAGGLLWKRRRSGGLLGVLMLPVGAVFWRGLALPLPPANALVRTVLLIRGWKHLRS